MSMSPILRGLLSGLQGFATTYAGQQQKAQDLKAKTDAQKQALQLEQEAWEKRKQWEMTNEPPKTMQETYADPDNPGKNLIRNLQWQPPETGTDPNLEKGQWLVNSTANDPNTMKLDQRSDEATQKAEQAAAKLEQQQAIAEARNQTRLAQIDAAQARGGKGAIQQLTDANGNATLVRIGDDNVAHPIQLEGGGTATKQEWRQRGGANPNLPKPEKGKLQLEDEDKTKLPILQGNRISPPAPDNNYDDSRPDVDAVPAEKGPPSPVFVDPSANRPMSQFSGAKAPASGSQAAALQAQAQAAIAKGADPAKVNARLQQLLQSLGQ